MGNSKNRFSQDSGIIVLITAVMLPIMLGVLGIIIDLGFAYQYKRFMQTAADAGALGAAHSLIIDPDSGTISTDALYDAGMNGFDGSSGETRTVNVPPLTGYFEGDENFIEVTISQDMSTYFMPVLGVNNMTVSARAVAGFGTGAGCIYVLNGTAEKAFEVSSGSTTTANNCTVKVSSCDEEALHVTSGSSLTAADIDVCGETNSSGGTVTPDPDEGRCDGRPCQRGVDPLGHLPQPTVPNTCDNTEFSLSSQGSTNNRVDIWPGTFCGGISIESGSHVNFNPGIYYLRGGKVAGLNIDSASSATGFGVTFFNTDYNSDYPYMPIEIQSGSNVQFSAPNDSEILFWQDRTITGDFLEYKNKIESDASSYFEGILYFPTQHLMFHSNTIGESSAAYTIAISDTLEVSSGTQLGMNGNLTGGQGGIDELEFPRFRGHLILWENGGHDAKNKTSLSTRVSPADSRASSSRAQPR